MRFLERLRRAHPAGDSVDAAQAKELQDAGALIIDVRESYEWAAGHVPGAKHIPLNQVASRLPDLPADREIVFMCQSGMRSLSATRTAQLAGRDGVRSLSGGIGAWLRAGLPLVRGE